MNTRKEAIRYILLFLLVALLLTGLLLTSAQSNKDSFFAVFAGTLFALFLIGSALNKVKPMLWKSLFARSEYQRLLTLDKEITNTVTKTECRYTLLSHFNLELLHIDFLVFDTSNITVIGRAVTDAPLHIEEGILMAGTQSLAKTTGNIWRICHLLNIIIKKGYDMEFMPKPLLVIAEREHCCVKEFDGITILSCDELENALKSLSAREERDDDTCKKLRGFAAYLQSRYIR